MPQNFSAAVPPDFEEEPLERDLLFLPGGFLRRFLSVSVWGFELGIPGVAMLFVPVGGTLQHGPLKPNVDN